MEVTQLTLCQPLNSCQKSLLESERYGTKETMSITNLCFKCFSTILSTEFQTLGKNPACDLISKDLFTFAK